MGSLSETYLRGAVGTGERTGNLYPEDWKKTIVDIAPPMMWPITFMMDNIGAENTTSRIFHWWEKPMPTQSGAVVDAYSDAVLATPIAAPSAVNAVVYLNVTVANARQFRVGDVVTVRSSLAATTATYLKDVTMVVIAISITDDAHTYLSCRLLQADNFSGVGVLESTQMAFVQTGFSQPELSSLPVGIVEDPTEFYNYTQIFAEAIEMSGTEIEEVERVSPMKWDRAISDALLRLKMKREKALIWGIRRAGTGANGKAERFTGGVKWWLGQSPYSSANIFNYAVDLDYAGKTWLNGGMDFLKKVELAVGKKSDANKKFIVTGDLGAQAIQDLVEDRGLTLLPARTSEYGIRIRTLVGLNQDFEIIQHPLFTNANANTGLSRAALIFEPKLMKWRNLTNRALRFIPPETKDDETGEDFIDGKKAGWLEEGGLMVNNLEAFAWVDGLGLANLV